MGMQPTSKIYIKNLEELNKQRFNIFNCYVHISKKDFETMPKDLHTQMMIQGNCFEIENSND